VSPKEHFVKFVDRVGGRQEAAVLLGCGYAAVDHAYTGRRDISADMAIKVERISDGEFRAIDLRPAPAEQARVA
jgi:DNA-binding transcriptional regulator YdaS (Cro superfamily)